MTELSTLIDLKCNQKTYQLNINKGLAHWLVAVALLAPMELNEANVDALIQKGINVLLNSPKKVLHAESHLDSFS